MSEKDASLSSEEEDDVTAGESSNEKTPLLGMRDAEPLGDMKTGGGWHAIPKRVASALIGSVKVILSSIAAPGLYVIACFYDEEGQFSAMLPIYRISGSAKRKKRSKTKPMAYTSDMDSSRETRELKPRARPQSRTPSVASSTTAVASDSELDPDKRKRDDDDDSPARHTRSKSGNTDQIEPARRSIRIKLYNEEAMKERKRRKESVNKTPLLDPQAATEAAAASLKSPTSPASTRMTRYPRAPAPPRPLIPRRQPSYTAPSLVQTAPPQKTLIIDLDETLIHSHSKGGRYTTGHMVEVKMQHAVGGGGVTIAPQVPILYYVHKRPYCDEFLRKVNPAPPHRSTIFPLLFLSLHTSTRHQRHI